MAPKQITRTPRKGNISDEYPIHAAAHAVSMLQKKMHDLEPAHWKQFADSIAQGVAQKLTKSEAGSDPKYNAYFHTMRPTHLINNANLTELCMKREAFDFKKHATKKLDLIVTTTNVENVPIQGEYMEATPETQHEFFPTDRTGKQTYIDISGTVDVHLCKSNLQKGSKYTSMMFENAKIAENLQKNLIVFLTRENKDAGETHTGKKSAKMISAEIMRMTAPDTKFKYIDVYHEPSFHTVDYTVHVFDTHATAQFETEQNGLILIKINRKIVLATMNQERHGNEPYTIPLCEELVVHVYKYEYFRFRLSSQSCVISAKLQLNRNEVSNIHQWHFFGNNAFTLHHTSNHAIRRNPFDFAAFMTGFISGQMLNTTNCDVEHKKTAAHFFRGLFRNGVGFGDTFERDSEITKYILSKLYAKHTKNEDKSPIEIPEATFVAKIKNESIPEKTFLASQKLNKMVYVTDNKPPHMKLFMISFTFCVVVLSPEENPAINAVFVGTLNTNSRRDRISEEDDKPQQFGLIDNTPNLQLPPIELERDTKRHEPTKLPPLSKTSRTRGVPSEFSSLLPPELELELELL